MINGFINLYKPATWTSHDCVARTRRLLQTKKVGHGGTLDPLATGVLPVAVGRATRLLQYLPERKAYRAVIRFGITTTTDDLEGEVATQNHSEHLQRQTVEAALSQFLGALSQTPPMYSAIQVDGKRLYDLARKGKTVEVPTRQVTIYQLTVQAWHPSKYPELTVDVDCGPGTYIRSLARDIGEAVGTGATLAQLTRTHSSGFDLESSITLEDLEQAIANETFSPYAAGEAVRHLSAIALPPALALRWRMGQKIALTETGIAGLSNAHQLPRSTEAAAADPVRIITATAQEFLGIGEIRSVPSMTEPPPATGNILAAKMVYKPVD